MAYILVSEPSIYYDSEIFAARTFASVNEFLASKGLDKVTATDYKNTDELKRGDYYVSIIYKTYPRYLLRKVTEEEYLTADKNAKENNERGLSFACNIQDEESLQAVKELLKLHSITGASFETYTGDCTNIFVRWTIPSFADES